MGVLREFSQAMTDVSKQRSPASPRSLSSKSNSSRGMTMTFDLMMGHLYIYIYIYIYIGVSKNRSFPPKIDCENKGENPMNKWMIWG